MKKSILFSSLIFCLLGFSYASDSFTAPPVVCSTPTWLMTSNITQTSATFCWDIAMGAQSYTVQTRLPNGTWYDVPGGPFTGICATVSGLSPGTTYEWRIRSNCGGGEYSAWSNPVPFTTLPGSTCYPPSSLNTTNITQTTATWSWSSVSGAASYSLQWRYPGGTWYNLAGGPWTNTWVNVGSLQPATTYEWRVRSNCTNGMTSAWSYSATFTTLGATCSTPTWPITSNISSTSATFSWDFVYGAQSYTVEYRLPNGTWYNVPGSPTSNTWITVYGLTPGTTYEWRVRANCSNWQYSNWTYPISFTTQGSTCNAPSWLSTTNIGQTTATINWAAVSGAMSYSVQWRLAGGTWYNLNGGPWTSTSLNLTGFQPATTYEWRVRSNCSYGVYSPWSYAASFTTLGYSCSTPTWPTTSNITQTSATFSWDYVSGAQSYTVQIRLPNGTWYDVAGSPTTNLWITAYGLTPSTTYEWRVRANCANWQYSSWTYPISFTTTGSSCNTPTWPSTSNITSTSATFSWSAVSGAQSYTVEYRLPNGTWYNVPGSPTSNIWITVNGLTPSTTYEWRVRANCSNWQSSNWTYPVVFTTSGGTSCYAPNWLYTTNITQTSATLDWSAVSGAISYSVQWRLVGGTWYDLSGGPWTNSWANISGLQPGTAYEWRVRSNCANGLTSAWSYTAWFTTLGYSCSTPTWPSTSNVTETSATFNWTAVSGALSYSVQYRLPNGIWYDVPGSPTTNTWITLTGLSQNTTYEWRVRANCANSQSSNWTYPITFTTSGISCNAPTSLYTTPMGQGMVTLDWSDVYGAFNYTVQMRPAGGTWMDLEGGPFTNSWVIVGGLQPGTTYEWRVRTHCTNGLTSAWSYVAYFVAPGGSSCNTPTWPSTSNITSTTATFSWSPVSGAQSYTVQTRLPNGTWYDVSGGPFTSTWATVYGLNPNTTYEWRVRANCTNWQYSNWTYPITFTTTGGGTCNTPTWPSTSNITSNSATFNWSYVSGAQSYTVQTRLPNGTWYDVPGSPTTSTWITVYNLNPNTTYEWRVRANCSNWQYSNWTYPITFTTSGGGSCNTPTWPTTSNITTTSATLSWSMSSGAISYTVQIRIANGTWYDVSGGPFTNNWVNVWGLNSNTTYEWRVRANCANWQYSNWTSGVFFTTYGSVAGEDPANNLSGNSSNNLSPDSEEQLESMEKDVPETLTPDYFEDISMHLRIMPNPASDNVNISLLQNEDCTVSVIALSDLSGKRIFTKTYKDPDVLEFSEQIDVTNVVPGIYIIQIVTKCGNHTEKVVVAH